MVAHPNLQVNKVLWNFLPCYKQRFGVTPAHPLLWPPDSVFLNFEDYRMESQPSPRVRLPRALPRYIV